MFWVRTRFSDSEHVSPTQWARFPDSEHVSTKFSELGVRSFGKTCSEWEHVSPTQNTFLRLRARFPDSEHVSTKFSELGVRSFGKTCSEWEHVSPTQTQHVSPTQNTFLRNFRSWELGVLEKRVLSENTFLWLRTHFSEKRVQWARFPDSEHVSTKFSELGVRSFGKTCSEWEHVSPTQSTFLRLRTRFYEIFGVGS